MPGAVSAAEALRDAFLAAGLGFILAAVYRAMRLVGGSSKAVCFVCDVVIFLLGAVFYRSAAMSVFISGLMRWYTALALLAGYGLCTHLLYAPLRLIEESARAVLKWPFLQIYRLVLHPLCVKMKKTRTKKPKNITKSLPKPTKVLYNSK